MDSRLIIVAVVAYLLGSIPFGYILVRVFLKQDIRATGSGNIGATNVARSGNTGLAIATLLLDAGKGALAASCVGFFFLPIDSNFREAMVVAPFMAILGHCFPIWLRFKGGKGVATAVGALSVSWSYPVLVAVGLFAIVFITTRYVSLGSVSAAVAFPLAVRWLHPFTPLWMLGLLTASSLLIILKHHTNIRRLVAGTEPKFGKKAVGWDDPAITEKNL